MRRVLGMKDLRCAALFLSNTVGNQIYLLTNTLRFVILGLTVEKDVPNLKL